MPALNRSTVATALAVSVKSWLNAVAALVYPEICQLCGQARATPGECFLCADCRAQVRFIKPPFCARCGFPYEGEITNPFECANCRDLEWPFVSARSAVVARGKVLEVIHRYKYNRALWFEPFLADLLVGQAEPELRREAWDWIVPVPLHPAKYREREFNQAERLAARLSAATRIPVNTGCLLRVLPTRTQTLLSREERLANVRKAFALRGNPGLEDRRIILVDDVFTTGATTGACARVLRAAGAGDVCVWTVARGI
jgi:ComF family protein